MYLLSISVSKDVTIKYRITMYVLVMVQSERLVHSRVVPVSRDRLLIFLVK